MAWPIHLRLGEEEERYGTISTSVARCGSRPRAHARLGECTRGRDHYRNGEKRRGTAAAAGDRLRRRARHWNDDSREWRVHVDGAGGPRAGPAGDAERAPDRISPANG